MILSINGATAANTLQTRLTAPSAGFHSLGLVPSPPEFLKDQNLKRNEGQRWKEEAKETAVVTTVYITV